MADVYVACVGDQARRAGFAAAEELRDALPGLRVIFGLTGSGLKAQLRRADRSGAQYAIIIGEEELSAGDVSVKQLRQAGPQERMTVAAFAEQMLRSRDRNQ